MKDFPAGIFRHYQDRPAIHALRAWSGPDSAIFGT
jgi:hypothetical protein